MYKLAPYVQIFQIGKIGYCGIGSNQKQFSDLVYWEKLARISHIFLSPNTLEEALRQLRIEIKISNIEFEKISDFLISNNFLVRDGIFDKSSRYIKNEYYYSLLGSNPKEVQHKIEKSRVAIVGCGGIGNHVSAALAACGVGKIFLIDNDTIEPSNLTRQILFSENDIGKKKIDVIKRELNCRNSNADIENIDINIDEESDLDRLPEVDLIITSADHPPDIIKWINRFCVRKKTAFINVGYINDISVVGPFYIPGKTSCFACQSVAPDLNSQNILGDKISDFVKSFSASTFPSVNGVAAYYALSDIIKYLGELAEPLSANKRIGIHSLMIKIEEQPMEKNDLCPVCG